MEYVEYVKVPNVQLNINRNILELLYRRGGQVEYVKLPNFQLNIKGAYWNCYTEEVDKLNMLKY